MARSAKRRRGSGNRPPRLAKFRLDDLSPAIIASPRLEHGWKDLAPVPHSELLRRAGGPKWCVSPAGALYQVPANELAVDWATGVPRWLGSESSSTNLLAHATSGTTQAVAVTAQAYTLSFYGTGTVTLSGAHSATLTGQEGGRRTLTFTPSAGTLALTPSGSVAHWQLETGSTATSWISTGAEPATRIADDLRPGAAVVAHVASAGGCTIVLEGAAHGADWLIGGTVNGPILYSSGSYRSDVGESITIAGLSSSLSSFGVALACYPTSRSGSADGGPVAASGVDARWGLHDETGLRFGSSFAGEGATKQLYIHGFAVWTHAGTDAALQTKKGIFA